MLDALVIKRNERTPARARRADNRCSHHAESEHPICELTVAVLKLDGSKREENTPTAVSTGAPCLTDPTGKYVCTGDVGGCDTIEGGLGKMRDAVKALKKSDPRRAELQAVINAYGKQGDPNSKISTVWINPRHSDGTPVLRGNAQKAFTMHGGTLSHEGKHMLQPSVVGLVGRPSFISLIFHE
jgi:hypothetical protein